MNAIPTDVLFFGSLACFAVAAILFAVWAVRMWRKLQDWLYVTRELEFERRRGYVLDRKRIRETPPWMTRHNSRNNPSKR